MAGESAREKAHRAREKSERLMRYAEAWEKGADGESQTATELARLAPEWTAWHDLKWPGRRFANIDHLVIGPSGIFVIDSKNWSGALTVKDNVLRQNGYRRETAVAGCADSALAVGELLPRYVDRVHPGHLFVREDKVDGYARNVKLCSTSNLTALLTSQATVLETDEIADAIATLQVRMSSGGGPQRSTFAPSAGRPTRVRPTQAPSHRPGRSPTSRRIRFFKRCATSLGLWFLACNALYLLLRPHVGQSGTVLGPTYAAIAVVAWLVARRLIR